MTRRLFVSLVAAGIALAAVAGSVQAEGAEWTEQFAQRIYKAWKNGEAMPQLSAARPQATLQEGYAVQKAFFALVMKEDPIGGFKAAVVGKAGQDNLGITGPITGVVPASGVLQAKDEVVITLADYPGRHLETEIGYVFKKAIRKPLKDIETLKRHVKSVVPMVEVPGGLTEDKHPGTAADLAAWNGNARQLILGPAHDPANFDLDALAITLKHDGKVINEAKGGQAAGGQWATLLKAVNDVTGRGYTIKRGQVLTNGALGKILKAKPGTYRADYGKLGSIAFEVK